MPVARWRLSRAPPPLSLSLSLSLSLATLEDQGKHLNPDSGRGEHSQSRQATWGMSGKCSGSARKLPAARQVGVMSEERARERERERDFALVDGLLSTKAFCGYDALRTISSLYRKYIILSHRTRRDSAPFARCAPGVSPRVCSAPRATYLSRIIRELNMWGG